MSSYTISKLAEQAGVSVHVVRDYLLRGLLHPVRRTDSGYGIFDAQSLARLRFVRTAFEAGIGLSELARWCQALDGGDGDIDECRALLRSLIAARRETLVVLDRQLAGMAAAARTHTEPERRHA
ncbi:TPA: mercuric resistance transcriptional repressor protein MerD [Pseudomonas putida]|nr:mercuric resistance transcriptional repressor protein MerD [Pseudomonas putida]